MLFKNSKHYDIFKYFVRYGIPSLSVAIVSLGEIWGYDMTKISQTLIVLQIFALNFLIISKERFYAEEALIKKAYEVDYEKRLQALENDKMDTEKDGI